MTLPVEFSGELIRRTYSCGTTTVEIPAVALGYLGKSKVAELLRCAKLATDKKKRNRGIVQMRADGWKVAAIASEVGLHISTVQDILRHSGTARGTGATGAT